MTTMNFMETSKGHLIGNFTKSFTSYKSKYALSMIYDLLALLGFTLGLALSYWIFGFLYEILGLYLGPFMFGFTLIIFTLLCYLLVSSLFIIAKFFSYSLWKKIYFKDFYRHGSIWFMPWFLTYLIVVLLFEQDRAGYLFLIGFVFYSLLTCALRFNDEISIKKTWERAHRNLSNPDLWISAALIALTSSVIFVLIFFVLSFFEGNVQAVLLTIFLLSAYLLLSSWAKNYMYLNMRHK